MMLSSMLRLTVNLLLLTLVAGSCPDDHGCEDEQTCCLIPSSGGYNCCPFHQGECCDDHIHCCPEGFLCQGEESKCSNATHTVQWAERLLSKLPDQAEVACCENFVHCCPAGKTCNLAAQTCDDSAGSEPWIEGSAQPTKLPESGGSVVPCNETAGCPDGSTCCKTPAGEWSCCPLVQAVCCEDHVHCCPQGTTCNLSAQKCEEPSGSVPWVKKEPSLPIRAKKLPEVEGSVVPCNETAGCPDGSTCCKTPAGEWSCCPLVQAVCCEDHVHCCPQGTTCNLSAQKCEEPSGSVPWVKKEPSLPIRAKKLPEVEGSVVPCNETVFCPDGCTCCKTPAGEWSCCPLVQAVCCEDYVHCCPQGTTCNLSAQKCESLSGSVPWMKKEPSQPIRAKKLPEVEGSDVPCNETVGCPDGCTCCKTPAGEWSCCPLVQAVCCEDYVHCCPHGTTCNLSAQKCESPSGSVPWLTKGPGRPIAGNERKSSTRSDGNEEVKVEKEDRTQCDPHHSCPDHTTCCLMNQTHTWGCCPLEEAVCCSDGVHCCPKGYTCQEGSCVQRQTESVPLPSIELLLSSPSQNDIQCGGGYKCKDSQTCCRMSETSWGCCPFPEAVCCSDMVHCCQTGYTCGDEGTCTQAPAFDWEHWEAFVSRKKKPLIL
ncbi:granulin a [Trichomycterus rosablanca]|uniref:granulin a n=1 Tax=Trichomycterus rosablanca TaxID=2290929 RepID=UPI002F358CC0